MIYIPWLVFAAVWTAGAFSGKHTIRREELGERAFHVIGSAMAAYLVLWANDPRKSPVRQEIGFVFSTLGVAFAIWARLLLGGNWSGLVTLKEGHELIRRGPYRIVRHPIYSGILLALFGTALWFGQTRSYAGVVIAFLTWWRKSRIEESLLVDYFGDRYREYQREVRALIPGLL